MDEMRDEHVLYAKYISYVTKFFDENEKRDLLYTEKYGKFEKIGDTVVDYVTKKIIFNPYISCLVIILLSLVVSITLLFSSGVSGELSVYLLMLSVVSSIIGPIFYFQFSDVGKKLIVTKYYYKSEHPFLDKNCEKLSFLQIQYMTSFQGEFYDVDVSKLESYKHKLKL